MKRLRTLAALLLAALMLLTSTASAAFEASHQLAHSAAGTQLPLPSEQGNAPGHGCANHLGAHLFAPLEWPAALPAPAQAARVIAPAPLSHLRAVPSGLFRPPRILLQA